MKQKTALALEEAKSNKQFNSASSSIPKSSDVRGNSQHGETVVVSSGGNNGDGVTTDPSVVVKKGDLSRQQHRPTTTEEAQAHIANFLCNTNRLGHHIQNYPTFDARELLLGRWLGKGGFSNVEEIRGFLHIPKSRRSRTPSFPVDPEPEHQDCCMCDDSSRGKTGSLRASPLPEELGYGPMHKEDGETTGMNSVDGSKARQSQQNSTTTSSSAAALDQDEEMCRQFLIKNCLRDSGETRYAIKHLRNEIARDPNQYPSGAMDLAIEALFLADLQHPNVVKLRGISTADPFTQDENSTNFYFLILDRLCHTLTDRMNQWRERRRKLHTLIGRITDISRRRRQSLLDERLAAAYDLSAAMAYLKTQRIIHRDIKPENLGFDIRGDIKIFDFGLARELRESDRDLENEGMFHLSSMTGSLRYMAPEVGISGTAYNEACDVYSFTIVLWEMLSLQRAYTDVGPTQDSFIDSVFVEQTRPALKHSWSRNLHGLFKQGWSHDPRERLTAEQCQDILRNELVNMRHGDDVDLDHLRRRSTYLIDEEARNVDESDGKTTWTFHRRSASTSDINAAFSQPKLPWAVKPRTKSF